MVKPSDDIKKLYPISTDKNAQTIGEIIKETGLGESTIRRYVRKMIEMKQWKEVMKKQGNHIVSAYIKIK